MRKGFLIYGEMRKYFPIYEEAVSHIWLCNCSTLNFPIYEENSIFFFISVGAREKSGQNFVFQKITQHEDSNNSNTQRLRYSSYLEKRSKKKIDVTRMGGGGGEKEKGTYTESLWSEWPLFCVQLSIASKKMRKIRDCEEGRQVTLLIQQPFSPFSL
jgi:hypothetical protein